MCALKAYLEKFFGRRWKSATHLYKLGGKRKRKIFKSVYDPIDKETHLQSIVGKIKTLKLGVCDLSFNEWSYKNHNISKRQWVTTRQQRKCSLSEKIHDTLNYTEHINDQQGEAESSSRSLICKL